MRHRQSCTGSAVLTPWTRLAAIYLAALVLIAVSSTAGLAHHGWRWTTGGNIELTGYVKTVKLGNPHGVITVDAEGEIWTVEVGQPWRNERAGLKPGTLVPGVEIRAVGEPAADPSNKLMKAERFYIEGQEYDLYPERS